MRERGRGKQESACVSVRECVMCMRVCVRVQMYVCECVMTYGRKMVLTSAFLILQNNRRRIRKVLKYCNKRIKMLREDINMLKSEVINLEPSENSKVRSQI